jgi:hypothetical protein
MGGSETYRITVGVTVGIILFESDDAALIAFKGHARLHPQWS